MSSAAPKKAVTVRDFATKKTKGEKLVVVSAYDALFARLSDEGGVDAVLVGDSLGNVIAGYDSTLPVTLDQMIYHGGAVKRGLSRAMCIVDMPFLTYQVSAEQALTNCGRVMQETGCQAVKLEGSSEEVVRATQVVVRAGIPVMAHIGFTPQYVNALGGYRVQGREPELAARMIEDAKQLEAAGAFSIVLELVPAAVATRISSALTIPTIGIGAGKGCDGQVLVLLDLLGFNDTFAPKFLKKYAELGTATREAVRGFVDDVRRGAYPDDEHAF